MRFFSRRLKTSFWGSPNPPTWARGPTRSRGELRHGRRTIPGRSWGRRGRGRRRVDEERPAVGDVVGPRHAVPPAPPVPAGGIGVPPGGRQPGRRHRRHGQLPAARAWAGPKREAGSESRLRRGGTGGGTGGDSGRGRPGPAAVASGGAGTIGRRGRQRGGQRRREPALGGRSRAPADGQTRWPDPAARRRRPRRGARTCPRHVEDAGGHPR